MTAISELENPGEIRHGLGPIWAATRVANPDFATCAAVTFRAGPVFRLSADAWRDTVFQPSLLPALRAALRHGHRGEFRELLALDQRLSAELDPHHLAASTRAGHRLAVIGRDLRGERLLTRLAEHVRTGTTPGHLSIVFAARCGAFSLPDRTAVGAYLFQELCAGAPRARVDEVCDFVAGCLEPMGAPGALRAA